MKKLILIIFIITIELSANAQQARFYKNYHSNAISNGTLTTLVGIHPIIADVCYERRFFRRRKNKPHFALEISGGKIIPHYGTGKSENSGFIFRVVPKYRFEHNAGSSAFIGWSHYYVHHKYVSTRVARQGNSIDYNVDSKIYGSSFLLGVQGVYKYYLLELSSGLGFKIYDIKNDSPIPLNQYRGTQRTPLFILPEGNGRHFRLNIPIHLKLGISF